ncbi:MAG: hypothetical protein ILO42_06885, partial [Clostridia bacterium]|nr:hypothetical protein [Clostridia bacterium]
MMKKRMITSLAAAALLLALTFTGCGPGSGSETTPPPSNTTAPVPETDPVPEILAVAGITKDDRTLTVADESGETFEVDGKIRVTAGATWAIF